MTLSTLICTKCQSAVAVTGRSVTLPFICDSCSQHFDALNALDVSDGPGYFKCSIPSCCCQNDPNYKESSPLIATEAPSCGDASVEATTKIIDDLTAQLEAERQTVMTGEGRIAELEAQLLEVKEEYTKLQGYCGDLGNYIQDDRTQIAGLFGRNIELLAEIDELDAELDEALAKKNGAEAKVQFAGDLITSIVSVNR